MEVQDMLAVHKEELKELSLRLIRVRDTIRKQEADAAGIEDRVMWLEGVCAALEKVQEEASSQASTIG